MELDGQNRDGHLWMEICVQWPMLRDVGRKLTNIGRTLTMTDIGRKLMDIEQTLTTMDVEGLNIAKHS